MTTVILDSQLLVLLVVGATSKTMIAKHKKTRQFDTQDFDLLENLIGNNSILLLPNTVTEASNHLMWHKPPERDRICGTLRKLVERCAETYVESIRACRNDGFLRLGTSDAALMIAADDGILLTADAQLYVAAEAKGLRVVNFNHERERHGLA